MTIKSGNATDYNKTNNTIIAAIITEENLIWESQLFRIVNFSEI